MRDLPGFFYDEDKGKYFPIHLKEAYEKVKKALKREEEKKLVEGSKKATDLYKFISNSPMKFDSVSERISRIKVNEIIWSSKLLQIDPDNDIYYRYNWRDGSHYIHHVRISTGEEVNSFRLTDRLVLHKFGVIRTEDNRNCYHYFTLEEEGHAMSSIAIFSPGGINILGRSVHSTLNSDVVYSDGRLYFFDLNAYSKLELKYLDGNLLSSSSEILQSRIDFLAAFPETGLIQVYKGGLIKFKGMNVRLDSSSAKWLHYYEGKLLILTYHGQFLTLTMSTKEQNTICDVKDLDLPERMFEDLIIDAKGKVVVIGYKNTTDLIFFNWIEINVIKKLSLSKPIEKFKISSDLLNLYIHTLQ